MIEPRRSGVLLGGAALVLALAAVLLWRFLASPPATPSPRPAQAAPVETQTPAASTKHAAGSSSTEARRARDAKREEILKALRMRGEPTANAPPPPASSARRPTPAAGTSAGETTARGHYDPKYIQTHFREDMFPLLRSCYENALAQRPTLAGSLVLTFTIVGDPSVGGVVEDADFAEESDLQDPEMETCVRESLMTLVFDKPPEGGGFVTVKYPIAFSPGDEDAGSDAGSTAP